MRWFYDRKTSTKLVMGFALMTLITGGTGWYATVTLREINANVDNLYQVQLLPSLELAGRRGLTHQLRANMYRALAASEPAELRAILAEQQELRRQLAEKQEQYPPTIRSPAVREAFTQYLAAAAEYDTHRLEKVIKPLQAGDREAATKGAKDGAPSFTPPWPGSTR